MVAEALARALAEKLLVPVVVTPTLRAGLSDHHLTFPGTVSLSQETFRGWIDAHIAGLERMGIERIAVFSGTAGTSPSSASLQPSTRRAPARPT